MLPDERQETSVQYITESSEETYREYAWALDKFFHDYDLKDIHDGHLRTYQDLRARCEGNWKKPCGQNRIHKEVGMLLRMLRTAHLWDDDLEDAFKQLPMQESELQRALSPSEQAYWLTTCLKEPDWSWIHDWSVLSLGTCASTFEVRMARLKDVNTRLWTFRVGPEASKNKFRNRTIPLESDEIRQAADNLMRRAFAFGAKRPEDYWLPFGGGSRRGDLDVTQPMTKHGIKHTWNEVRERSGFTWLRPYDMRHTAITRMAERGVPMAIIMAFAGQVSPRMQQHYTTISMQVKRETALEMSLKKPPMPVRFMPSYQYA
jgi:integrase